jgi:dipeptidase E
MENQTKRLSEVGCSILNVKVTNPSDSTMEEARGKIGRADVIVVSGGNTLFAVDRWTKLGLHEVLREVRSEERQKF